MLRAQLDGWYSPDSHATRQEPASYDFTERQGDLCRVRIRGLRLFPPNLSASLRYAAETVSLPASSTAYKCKLARTRTSSPWSKSVTPPTGEHCSLRRPKVAVTAGMISTAPA